MSLRKQKQSLGEFVEKIDVNSFLIICFLICPHTNILICCFIFDIFLYYISYHEKSRRGPGIGARRLYPDKGAGAYNWAAPLCEIIGYTYYLTTDSKNNIIWFYRNEEKKLYDVHSRFNNNNYLLKMYRASPKSQSRTYLRQHLSRLSSLRHSGLQLVCLGKCNDEGLV